MKGIGEKFAANPTTGSGSITVPIASSPGRAGFSPQLSLSYDSGAGNGPFGFGWSVALPAITRKTDKGLPEYDDVAESDVFILSGVEDLVPTLVLQENRWVRETSPPRTVGGVRYDIQQYRPRIEGLFARIERWSNRSDATDVFWRSISRDNVTTWYGRTAESRVADPADARRIFSWLVCESHDDKGNVTTYGYKRENDELVPTARASEGNRERGANRYVKRIQYGSHTPYLPALDPHAPWPALPANDQWYFELVFDYGEHDAENPVPADGPGWGIRPDPFSSYRSGFEVRTHRRCQRILMFHHFPDQPDVGADCLVRSTALSYSDAAPTDVHNPIYSKLVAVTQWGHQRSDDGYRSRCLPPVEFGYSEAVISGELRELDDASLENLPIGLDGTRHRWVDLDGEGLPGILTEQSGAWLFKRNLSPINTVTNNGDQHVEARFAAAEVVGAKPALALARGAQFLDLAGDGRPDVVQFAPPASGFYEHAEDTTWEPFTAFRTLPNRDWNDPNLRFVDLNGDGLADVLVTEHDALTWHPSLGDEGFGPERRVPASWDEERGPAVVFADGEQTIHLADMSGDGLTDLVRIRNGEICYWPNLGHGRFGAKVTMDGPLDEQGEPTHVWVDRAELFDPRRVHLADVDGSGTTDIIYLGDDGIRIHFNQSGNCWGAPVGLPAIPPADSATTVQTVDLLGNGTACLIWSSPLPADARRPIRYLDLMGGQKPHLLVTTNNNLGAQTDIQYAPSTKFYLLDRLAGHPWATKLPFPVHVVERSTVRDKWRGTSFSTTYSYHHGYFDGPEREFRGFGRVEQVDVEDYGTFAAANTGSPYVTPDHRLFQPPIKTVTWFHTGGVVAGAPDLHQFQREYFPNWFEDREPGQQVLGTFHEHPLTDADLDAQPLTADERRQALRACKGMPLRQEVYELELTALEDGQNTPIRLFSATSHACQIRLLQPQAGNRHAVLHPIESESINYHYELDLRPATLTPDPRINHILNLRVDEYGNSLQTVTIGYPRWQAAPLNDPLLAMGTESLIVALQNELHVSYVETRYTGDVLADPDSRRLRLPCETQTHELTGVSPHDLGDGRYFALNNLRELKLSDRYQTAGTPVEELAYQQLPDSARLQKRLVQHTCALFFDDALDGPLNLGVMNVRALPYELYALVLTDALLDNVFGDKLTADVTAALDSNAISGFLRGTVLSERLGEQVAGQYWRCTGVAGYQADALQHFLLPERFTDPFGNLTKLEYDPRRLYLKVSTDALENRTEINEFDFRLLAPRQIQDVNGNRVAAYYDVLGMPVATALIGKLGEGDNLDHFDGAAVNLELATLRSFFITNDYDPTHAKQLLGGATTRHLYYFGDGIDNGVHVWATHPPAAAGMVREQHVAQQPDSALQTAFEYSDGTANVLVKKIQAEPTAPHGELRWVSNGKAIVNNKAKPVLQFEPYFSQPEIGHRFEEPQAAGVATLVFYDAVGRQMRVEAPDGSYSRVEFSPWQVAGYDANDTVLEPGNVWYQRMTNSAIPAERRAAQLAAAHSGTPNLALHDSLGRTPIAVVYNRTDAVAEKHVSFTRLDAAGNPLWIQDARGNRVMQYVTPPLPAGAHPFDDPLNLTPQGFTRCHDLSGRPLFQHGDDAGDRWTLNDAGNQPLYSWSSRGFRNRLTYDALRRPIATFVSAGGNTTLAGAPRDPDVAAPSESLVELRFYGENHPDRAANLRGKPYRTYDGAGAATHARYDFKGNLLTSERRFAAAHTSVPDWSPLDGLTELNEIAAAAEPLLETAEPLSTLTAYDAMNRATTMTTPDGSIHHAAFNEANLLERVELTVGARADATAFVTNIDYDAKGQRLRIDYGNGATTRYLYDPFTFRLTNLRTTRPANPDASASTLFAVATVVQDLRYTYDPVGNIVRIEDAALNTTVQAGAVCEYVYDARYRLVAASGREHSGQTGFNLTPNDTNRRDYPFVGARTHPNDLQGLRDYVERYRYDAVGNIMQLAHHTGSNVEQPGQVRWQRHYQYALDSNRLLATSLPTDPDNLPDYVPTGGYGARYTHDEHGNITRMAHLPALRWDYRDRLSASSQQIVNDGTPETTYYLYDAAGKRVRKVTDTQMGARKSERLYVGNYEIYREYDGADVAIERQTVHLLDDTQRIAIVETQTTAGAVGAPLLRYQLGNHLGSASIEVDHAGAVIGYEEYHPHGTTAFETGRNAAEVSLKRYRYTGKERDDETGLSYHGARYYAPWLGRWIGTDPAQLIDGLNLYAYVRGNPIRLSDGTGMYGWSDFNKDVAQANRAAEVLMAPAMGPLAPMIKAATTKTMEAITGKSVMPGESPKQLTPNQRADAGTDALMALTPVGPLYGIGKVATTQITKVMTNKTSKADAAFEIAKTEPTGIVSKADHVVVSIDRAEVASKKGTTGDAVRAYIDVGVNALDLVGAVAAVVIGARAGGEGPPPGEAPPGGGPPGPPAPPTGGGSGGGTGAPKGPYIPRDAVTGEPIPFDVHPGTRMPKPLPEAQGRPHTVLAGRTSTTNPGEVYRQSAEFPGPSWPKAPGGVDAPTGVVDWSSHAGIGDPHPNPHVHPFVFDFRQGKWATPSRQSTPTQGNPGGVVDYHGFPTKL